MIVIILCFLYISFGSMSESCCCFSRVLSRVPIDAVEPVHDQDSLFIHGVPIDYRYNETARESYPDERISSPGCPRSIENEIWVYYGNEGKCHLTGIRVQVEEGACPFEELRIDPVSPQSGICVRYRHDMLASADPIVWSKGCPRGERYSSLLERCVTYVTRPIKAQKNIG